VALTTLNYVWPLCFTVPMSPPPSPPDDPTLAGARWGPGYFAGLASQTNAGLGIWAAICSVLSCTSNFIPQLATASRALQATAKMGMVPGGGALEGYLAFEDTARGGTPSFSIVVIIAFSGGLSLLNFNTLVTTQILLALIALILQFAAFLMLKYKTPMANRPYAVPGGLVGGAVLSIPFFFLAGVIFYSNVAGSTQNIASLASVVVLSLFLTLVGHLWWVRCGVFSEERCSAVLFDGAGSNRNVGAQDVPVDDKSREREALKGAF
jgi:amino acid transporter